MAQAFGGSETNQRTIIGHPVGLFVLFFTEMWERFSYYGMRAILVLYLISTFDEGGFNWTSAEALVLYGWYTGLVYLTPLLGGLLADKAIGFRYAVVLGALLMTLGHASLALENIYMFYVGLGLLVLGNGAFKPNISSIVGNMYPEGSPLRDGAYTIFYMGVNSGAFLGILICGWLGETKGWSIGFGVAGIFMFFGLLQFWFGQKIFGNIGLPPSKDDAKVKEKELETDQDPQVEKHRLWVIGILAFFVIFFWLAFEQAGGSMTIFAKQYTARGLSSEIAVNAFRYISLILTFIPMLILTGVLVALGLKIFKKYPLTILFTTVSFSIIWYIIVTINIENFTQEALEVPASWFGTLNAFFIIALAPVFSTMWVALAKTKYNPSGPIKFALGLWLLGAGFVALVFGAISIPQGAESASVSMIYLILAYFLHTLGELCLSPVGLSYVSKLSPKRLLGLMFGIWFLANFVANTVGGLVGSYMEEIQNTRSMSDFFMIFVISSLVAGLGLVLLNKKLREWMHGVE